MALSHLLHPEWYQALSLGERLNLLREAGHHAPPPEDRTLAERRVARWRAQPPFSQEGALNRRLAAEGIREDEFLAALGTPEASLRQRLSEPPAWMVRLEQAYSRQWPEDERPLDGVAASSKTGFLEFVGPLIRAGREQLREGIRRLGEGGVALPFEPATAEVLLLANLPERIHWRLGRTLVTELQVARLEGRLQGDTPEQRFENFVEQLRQPAVALALLRQYPVLARQLLEVVDQWVDSSLEFLTHLRDDWEALRARFFPGTEPGPLEEARGGGSDPHRGGRTVLRVRFASGLQLIYKPRSLAVEERFQRLLDWLNTRGAEPGFRTLEVLERGDHGWVEFVTPAACGSEEEVRRFYRRQGGYLALLHLLEATDFHYENLIAAGEHPMLVDLETLFHPSVEGSELQGSGERAGGAIQDAVLRVGLLPNRIWSQDDSDGVDLSGMSAQAGQLTPTPVLTVEQPGTDAMHFTRAPVPVGGGDNRPTLGGQEIHLSDYAESFIEGFKDLYQFLVRHRRELLAPEGPLAAMADAEIRVLFRATRGYGALLSEGFHPHMLRNALERERLFDRLWGAAETRPFMSSLTPLERRHLERGDIPLFTTRPGSRDLWAGPGEHLAGFLPESGLERVARRLSHFGDEDLARQLWVVRGALATISLETRELRWPSYAFRETANAPPAERFLDAAREVGERLAALAFRGRNDAHWMIPEVGASGRWSLKPAASDLYHGLPGIALFLAWLGAETGESRYTALARGALVSLRDCLAHPSTQLTSIGAFSGWGGIVYLLTHLGVLWEEPALLDEAEAVVERLESLIDSDQEHDVVGGAAGAVLCLLALHAHRPSERTVAVARRCGERLLAQARPQAQGIAWLLEIAGPKPLAGLAHGVAGIAWALLALASATGDERFRHAAQQGLAYERSLYSPRERNWPDLRQGASTAQSEHGPQPHFMTAWCHGAAGVGLARLGGLRFFDDEEARREVEVALETTLAEGFGKNHSLCHGDLGNIELLLEAARQRGDEALRARAFRLAGGILEGISEQGWLYGMALGAEPPGLMVGLAGIGFGLLRLSRTGSVPSVTLLAPPPGGNSRTTGTPR